jgi:class 3 adenylate cyclase/tetratricopeptide (TPR) repeat protein
VTVLFCDLVGSTSLGESTDPEAVRALLARYFERMKGIVERHGGTVEKFIGDAVMAVFGLPVVHEDDALRAVRAAVEMRDAFPELGIEGRIGVTTGEVVTGTAERLATGDAINVAARLEEAAQAGQVLIGEETLWLTRDAVEVGGPQLLELKGKAKPVAAYWVFSVKEAPRLRHEAHFVGREHELPVIQSAWDQAAAGACCQLVTIVGEAGVGKSRLVSEAMSSIGARVVRGRCLPYGEGITYSPVLEVLKQIAALPSEPAAASAIHSLLGESEFAASAEELAWAFRKLLEEQAPLVCVFDDIQWAEETFLDLVEHVALLSSGSPILLVCMARPELVERRATWPVTLRLGPLADADVDELIGARVTPGLRDRIARAAGGNPLFVTQMLSMATEAEGDEVKVPPTLKALLAARLDQLAEAERRVLERGSVEGEIFHRGAVQALAPEEMQVTPRLAVLVRKGLILPAKPQLPGEDGFRFRHLLIRDAAYDALPKATRAELHERFAAWLQDRGDNLVELDELLGYHLEQAARYKTQLGQPDPGLSARAGEHLAAAGRRALWRGDKRAAVPLFERALELTRPLRTDVHVELDLADAQPSSRAQAAVAEAAAERACEAGDRVGEALALVVAAEARTNFDEADAAVDELERLARAALPLLENAKDDAGVARVWSALTEVACVRGRFEEWAQAAEQALRHFRLAGQHHFDLPNLPAALVHGPRPADEALQTLDSVLPANPSPATLILRAELLAMLGRLDDAWEIALPAGERLRELTGDADGAEDLAAIAELAGDHATAAGHLRRACDMYQRWGSRTLLATYAPKLGIALCALGRFDEAEPLAQLGRELGGEHDFATQTLWRQVQAVVHAHRGEHSDAARVAREAVAIAERTDNLNLQGDALCGLAEVLAASERTDEAASTLEQAVERYRRKKNLAKVTQTRARLAELADGLHTL